MKKENVTVTVTKANFEMSNRPKNGKPIICIETGEIFPSAKQLAEEKSLNYIPLIMAMKKGKPYKGNHYAYVVDLAYNVNVLCDVLQKAYQKANQNEAVLRQFTALAQQVQVSA